LTVVAAFLRLLEKLTMLWSEGAMRAGFPVGRDVYIGWGAGSFAWKPYDQSITCLGAVDRCNLVLALRLRNVTTKSQVERPLERSRNFFSPSRLRLLPKTFKNLGIMMPEL
jgi:hypothetical protein